MGKSKISKDEVKIVSSKDTDKKELLQFYQEAFPERERFTLEMWSWINRSNFYDNENPHLLVYKDKLIAHAGMIPVNVAISNKVLTVSWFTDYVVLPEYQRRGLGGILAKKWMEYSDIHIALSCSDMSIGAFRKLGWKETMDTYLHINAIKPFNHPAFVRRLPSSIRSILNVVIKPFVYLIYRPYTHKDEEFSIKKLETTSLSIFLKLYNKTVNNYDNENRLSSIRDEDFVNWRILNSPNREKYYTYLTEEFGAIILVNNNHGDYIDILWVSDNSNYYEIRSLIANLYKWAKTKKVAYIRFYTTNSELSKKLKKATKSYIQHPRFAFFAKDKELLGKLQNINWDIELIDNDFEKHL